MATANPFDLLIDDDNDDPSQLIAKLLVAAQAAKKSPAGAVAAKPADNHSPAQAVQEARNDYQRGGGRLSGRGNGHGGGRGGRGFTRDFTENENNSNGFNGGYRPLEDGVVDRSGSRVYNNNGTRGGFRGGRRGGYTNGGGDADGERPRRANQEKKPVFTLGEYEKVLEEKRKALLELKSEERKVYVDKDLARMQLLSNKKSEEDIFVKLGAEKEKRKETADKEEKANKSLNIPGFLKPVRYVRPGGWGRGRGRGPHDGGGRGGYGNSMDDHGNIMDDVAPPSSPPRKNVLPAPSIEDVGQFPSLMGVK